jgi:hypothetical protein
MPLHARTRTTLAWLLWLTTFGCCAAGLLVTLAVTRPLTFGVLVARMISACPRDDRRTAVSERITSPKENR